MLYAQLSRDAVCPSFAKPAPSSDKFFLAHGSLQEELHVQVWVPSVRTVGHLERTDTMAMAMESLEALPRLTSREPAICPSDSTPHRSQVVTKAVSNGERQHGDPLEAPGINGLLDLPATLRTNLPPTDWTLPAGATTQDSAEMRAIPRLPGWIVERPAYDLDLRRDATAAAVCDPPHADRSQCVAQLVGDAAPVWSRSRAARLGAWPDAFNAARVTKFVIFPRCTLDLSRACLTSRGRRTADSCCQRCAARSRRPRICARVDPRSLAGDKTLSSRTPVAYDVGAVCCVDRAPSALIACSPHGRPQAARLSARLLDAPPARGGCCAG
jgi:hypothetical protein